MARRTIYNVKIGHNVPSLKPAPEAQLYPLLEFEEHLLVAKSRRIGWEGPVCLMIAGGLLGILTPYMGEIEMLKGLHAYVSIAATVLCGLAGLTLLVWGLGLLGAQKILRIEPNGMTWTRTFLWIPKIQTFAQMPEFVMYSARRNRGEQPSYAIDLRLKLPEPLRWISVYSVDGYTQLHEADGAHLLDYERALKSAHEKANEIAVALNITHRPNLGKGPVPGFLRNFYKAGGAEELIPEKVESEMES
jgi:hypothetical protein